MRQWVVSCEGGVKWKWWRGERGMIGAGGGEEEGRGSGWPVTGWRE